MEYDTYSYCCLTFNRQLWSSIGEPQETRLRTFTVFTIHLSTKAQLVCAHLPFYDLFAHNSIFSFLFYYSFRTVCYTQACLDIIKNVYVNFFYKYKYITILFISIHCSLSVSSDIILLYQLIIFTILISNGEI